MSRILFVLVLLVVGYLLLKSWQRNEIAKKKSDKTNGLGRLLKKKSMMVRCEQCNLHVPEPEAVKHGGQYFCSLEHAQQAQNTKQSHKR